MRSRHFGREIRARRDVTSSRRRVSTAFSFFCPRLPSVISSRPTKHRSFAAWWSPTDVVATANHRPPTVNQALSIFRQPIAIRLPAANRRANPLSQSLSSSHQPIVVHILSANRCPSSVSQSLSFPQSIVVHIFSANRCHYRVSQSLFISRQPIAVHLLSANQCSYRVSQSASRYIHCFVSQSMLVSRQPINVRHLVSANDISHTMTNFG